ncbi:MAG: hypothetical protein ACFFHV_02240 [Promethearchaeota archaeon]
MAFCGNVIELVEKHKVLDEKENFFQWKEIEDNPDIEIYIENDLISEFKEKKVVFIDIAIGELNGEQIGLLFIKKQKDVYG